MMSPHRGFLATNEQGQLGVIVDFFRGRYTGFAYPANGHSWSSKNPKVLSRIGVRDKQITR